ncbi:unnamed protein product [Pleuronectes platessa]|uniref:Uncharacterized protein n=1 Tax=Pleuronectes platessa TaxID=8262 RepID=A0A9N7VMC2_PLEPL|nr:unnamed protein product [Pleuronectes platessa]
MLKASMRINHLQFQPLRVTMWNKCLRCEGTGKVRGQSVSRGNSPQIRTRTGQDFIDSVQRQHLYFQFESHLACSLQDSPNTSSPEVEQPSSTQPCRVSNTHNGFIACAAVGG